MANQDLEALARALLAANRGPDTAAALERVGEYLKTEDGRRLLAALSSGGEDAASGAARAALSGDEAGVRAFLSALLSTREGAGLARALLERR